MLIPVITQYLETHKRLVIPQLGAFIVKEPGRAVLFSELLKRDDGVLRGLLCARGLNELEAAGEIDRFVFEVRHAVEHGLVCPLPGLGEMKGGTNGTIVFTYDPRPTAPVAAPEPETPVAESAGAPAASHDGGVAAAGADEASGEARNPSRRPQFDAGRMAETMKSAFTEPHVSPSAKMNPDPSVRGLRYGKPPKNTDAYTYVNRVPRRRGDRFIWIAIIAAALAVAAEICPAAEVLIAPVLQLVKATPVASFIILALVWVRGSSLSVLISFLMVLPVLYGAVRTGIRAADPQLLEMAKVFRLPLGRRLRAVWLPAVLPAFRQGCSVALGICWKSGVAAEVIGLPDGSIGDALYRAKITLSTGELFAWTFVIILLSAGFEKLFLALLDKAVARVLGEDVTKND